MALGYILQYYVLNRQLPSYFYPSTKNQSFTF